ncbi:MFS transporter [Chitinasiproducens palmae]|uniref:MFS transporter, MHS family, proline/betaine transporter n=1 Tax=Chitinasiproducens palmae TaxID=1770053 RepID=A0A1H2PLW9_9BURK|nr:MFS transporter [Chitinasiproducens palmae]SDV46671.1 MFS transporter, MHS family, proline/betaine transporter [Chitinasiproducens palmae]
MPVNPSYPAAPALPNKSPSARRIIISSSIGNALEWYDFLVYGFFASAIASQIFPAHNEFVSMLLAIGSFSLSFLTRPIGALVLGLYADRRGRRAALSVSIGLMVLGTFVVAAMPSYAQIGIVAPIAVLCARLVQGFAVGGEFGSATAFMVEHSAANRGYYASWQFASQGMAAIAASGIGAVLSASMPADALQQWGWRLPFVIGLLVGPVGWYIRSHLDETPEFIAAQRREVGEPEHPQAPAQPALFSSHWLNLLLAIGIVAQSTVSVYVLQLYMPTYAAKQLGLPVATSFAVVVLNGGLQMIFTPVMGAWSDRIGRIRIMLGASLLMLLLIYPLFALLQKHPTVPTLMMLMAFSGIMKAAYSGPMPALMSEIFPTKVRSTGLSLAYSLGVTVFGGFAPFIVTWVIGVTGNKLAPAYYVLAAAILSGIALIVVGLRQRRMRCMR